MRETTSPGEIAHATYVRALHQRPIPLAYLIGLWSTLPVPAQAAWEAAAQAVIAAWWRQHEALRCRDEEEQDA